MVAAEEGGGSSSTAVVRFMASALTSTNSAAATSEVWTLPQALLSSSPPSIPQMWCDCGRGRLASKVCSRKQFPPEEERELAGVHMKTSSIFIIVTCLCGDDIYYTPTRDTYRDIFFVWICCSIYTNMYAFSNIWLPLGMEEGDYPKWKTSRLVST